MVQIVSHFQEISARYKAAFVDLWGCMHNGIRAYEGAVKAMQGFRATGGIVILVTNSPRPWPNVAQQVVQFGIPQDAYDAIATSGDSARTALYLGAVGEKVAFLGKPEEEEIFFTPPKILKNPTHVTVTDMANADGIVCTGPIDATADLDIHRPLLLGGVARGLKLLCANPDIIVDRGDVRQWCAGAVAELYTQMGGESLYFGKPHPPIYDLARRRLAQINDSITDHDIIAIGDGISTDIQGAQSEDIDTLFITGGLAKEETATQDQPDPERLASYLTHHQLNTQFAIGYLR